MKSLIEDFLGQSRSKIKLREVGAAGLAVEIEFGTDIRFALR